MSNIKKFPPENRNDSDYFDTSLTENLLKIQEEGQSSLFSQMSVEQKNTDTKWRYQFENSLIFSGKKIRN